MSSVYKADERTSLWNDSISIFLISQYVHFTTGSGRFNIHARLEHEREVHTCKDKTLTAKAKVKAMTSKAKAKTNKAMAKDRHPCRASVQENMERQDRLRFTCYSEQALSRQIVVSYSGRFFVT